MYDPVKCPETPVPCRASRHRSKWPHVEVSVVSAVAVVSVVAVVGVVSVVAVLSEVGVVL